MKLSLSLCLLFCILVAVQPTVYGQTVSPDQATMIDSFGRLPNGDLRGRLDLFLANIANLPRSKGLVYVHGTPSQIAVRTRLVQNHLGFRSFDTSRVAFIPGRNIGDVRSDLWIVPSGAPEPDTKPEAWISKEVGPAAKSALFRGVNAVINESFKFENHQTYIINYGNRAQVAQRERWIRSAITSRRLDASRITLVNGGIGPVRTVMWLVPPGAENPAP